MKKNIQPNRLLKLLCRLDEEIIQAIKYRDREMLEDVLKDYLHL